MLKRTDLTLLTLSIATLYLQSCYEPLGSSVVVKASALQGVCRDASSVEVRLLKSGEVQYTVQVGAPQVYEAEERLCDGLDNDCDGVVDESPDAPLADNQVGVCEGVRQTCDGVGGWTEPDYTVVNGYGDERCDGLDNDCDGLVDEELDGPLAENQVGVCEGALQSCMSGDWVSDYSGLSDYKHDFGGVLSDRLDNDCDGDVDEEPPPPCAPNCPDLDFVRIEGGSFMMGDQRSSPDSSEIPVHNVNVPTFEMMRTEITVAQFRACVNASACSTPRIGTNYTWSSNPDNKEDHPINGVSWHQLMEFAAWMGARLPTEAEWEYAARGEGQDIIYPWGDNSPTCSLANYSGCVGSTSPVCSHPTESTSQELCDMAGNVWEWVQDEWHTNYNGAPNSGGWCTGLCPVNASDPNYNASDSANRVLCGGGWYNSASYIRAAVRDNSSPSYQVNSFGGRLAKDILTP